MKVQEKIAWPPVWTSSHAKGENFDFQGGGILRDVLSHDHEPEQLTIGMDYKGSYFIGTVNVGSARLSSELCLLLRANTGKTIQAIGQLEWPESIEPQQ